MCPVERLSNHLCNAGFQHYLASKRLPACPCPSHAQEPGSRGRSQAGGGGRSPKGPGDCVGDALHFRSNRNCRNGKGSLSNPQGPAGPAPSPQHQGAPPPHRLISWAAPYPLTPSTLPARLGPRPEPTALGGVPQQPPAEPAAPTQTSGYRNGVLSPPRGALRLHGWIRARTVYCELPCSSRETFLKTGARAEQRGALPLAPHQPLPASREPAGDLMELHALLPTDPSVSVSAGTWGHGQSPELGGFGHRSSSTPPGGVPGRSASLPPVPGETAPSQDFRPRREKEGKVAPRAGPSPGRCCLQLEGAQ